MGFSKAGVYGEDGAGWGIGGGEEENGAGMATFPVQLLPDSVSLPGTRGQFTWLQWPHWPGVEPMPSSD